MGSGARGSMAAARGACVEASRRRRDEPGSDEPGAAARRAREQGAGSQEPENDGRKWGEKERGDEGLGGWGAASTVFCGTSSTGMTREARFELLSSTRL
jgi:hypothetical protein